ncbi:MAG: polysaccharide deacetylase family protein [Clostridiales bacterium]|nr:polysaccharide deacetylase family protein [Clostridiales bacterium]
MDKYLIINADDFGMCHAQNLAIMDLLKKGCITSSTIMAPCGWAYEAVKFAAENPSLAIGVHWTLTSEWGTYRWSPVNSANKSLCDETGFMWHESDQVEDEVDGDEVENELRAQIEKLKLMGLDPSHVDNHMGSVYGIQKGRLELLNIAIDVAGEYGLPFRFPSKISAAQMDNDMLDINIDKNFVASLIGKFTEYATEKGVAMPDYLIPNDWNGPQRDSYENFKEYMYELYRSFPEGVTETYVHPAVESDELKAITGNWQRRVWEYRLMGDPATKQHIASCGIKLINYRDLKKMKLG